MVATIKRSLRDSAAARWTALFIVSFTMMCGYFLSDVMSPLAGMLESQLGWSRADYGTYTSSYGWFNVFLFMLIFGGIILDKLGIRITGFGATVFMVVGTAIKYCQTLPARPFLSNSSRKMASASRSASSLSLVIAPRHLTPRPGPGKG